MTPNEPSLAEIEALAASLLPELIADHADDIDSLFDWLKKVQADPSALQDIIRFKHTPVSPREFFTNKYYIGPTAEDLFPVVLQAIEDICSGEYVEAVLTGGIGCSKTTIAIYVTVYFVYYLSCLRNPQQEFGLLPQDEIIFVFQSINASTAKGVDYMRFRALIESSPYFADHFRFDDGILNEMRFPNRILVIPVSSATTAIIGRNVFGGILDEVNFFGVIENSKNSKDGGAFDQAQELYNAIVRRRESRFQKQGKVPGMLCLVSSKQYPGEFTDQKMLEAERQTKRTGKTNIYVYDKCVWHVKPIEYFTGEWFRLFLGDAARKPRILKDDEPAPGGDEELIRLVPKEYYASFENDLLASIRDIAGHSTFALHPYILDTDKVVYAFGRAPSIFDRDSCDFVATRPKTHPGKFKNAHQPRFVHLDLALTGDSAGVACGYIRKFVEIRRTPTHVEVMPEIVYDFVLEVTPPKGGEIQFHEIRALLFTLRDLGLPIKWVSMDSWQSTDMKQLLIQAGFVAGIVSCDTSTLPYDITKQAIMDGRLRVPSHQVAQDELIRLERDPKTRKIDHPPQGSKDCSDAMAGVCYGLTGRREIWLAHNVPLSYFPEHLATKGE
jgi:hypothetical protein